MSLELLSTEEIVPMNTVDSVFCELSRVIGTLCLDRNVAVEF